MEENEEMKPEASFIERLRESPRTVSALIIILIVAAAIYAFSGEDGSKQKGGDTGQGAVLATDFPTPDSQTGNGAIDDTNKNSQAAETVAGQTETNNVNQPTVAEARRTERSFVEIAEAGNGVTHLARKATNRWLSENQTNYSITDEHRIFIEDYIKDNIGSRGLSLGEEIEISFDLIAEAVEAAGQLNETQLKNLSQYTSALK